MNRIVSTRILKIKKEWKSLLLWLISPIIMTAITLQLINYWGDDTKIPIALVVEEETELSNQLVDKISNTSSLQVHLLNYREAMNQLEKHELDSVFVIKEGYEEDIQSFKRNRLVEAYSSNQSYAYFAVVELIRSYVQEDVSRSKAAFEVKEMYEKYDGDEEWNWQEIVQSSREKQEEQQLIQTDFTYQNNAHTKSLEDPLLADVWGIWALFSMIATFFIFDWVIKENKKALQVRWLYTTSSFKKYALINLLFYTVILLIFDFMTLFLLYEWLHESIEITSFILFRVVINLLAFLQANMFEQPFIYYLSSIGAILILVILGGAIIPIEGLKNVLPWIGNLSPVHSLLTEQIPVYWLIGLIGLLMIWYWKGDKINA